MTEDNYVEIKIASAEKGHETVSLKPEQAVNELKQQQEEDKWVFVDGKVRNTDELTEDDVANAEDIFVTQQLKGGLNE